MINSVKQLNKTGGHFDANLDTVFFFYSEIKYVE